MTISESARLIIFDVDGVLLNSQGGIRAFQEMLNRSDLKWNPKLKGKITPMMLIRAIEGADSPNDKQNLIALFKSMKPYLPSLFSRLRLFRLGMKIGRSYEFQYGDFFPGVVELLKTLASQGYYLGICSNAESPRLVKWLERKGLLGIIKCWVTRDDRKEFGLKPSGKPLLAVIERIKKTYGLPAIETSQIIYIGDNVVDLLAGQNAGIKTVAVLSGHGTEEELRQHSPTLLLNSLIDLPPYLQRLFEY